MKRKRAEMAAWRRFYCSQQLLPGRQEPPLCRRDLAETGWAWAARPAEGGREERQRKMRSNVERKERTINLNQSSRRKEREKKKRRRKRSRRQRESQLGEGGAAAV